MKYDLIVIGAGPAGLSAAITAGRRGGRVLVCERMQSPGRKLLVTGGGRCNITADVSGGQVMAAFGRHGRFMSAALKLMDPAAIRAWLAKAGIPTVVEPDGSVFPVSQKARDVLDALLRAASRARVELRCSCEVVSITRESGHVTGVKTSDSFLQAKRVVLAAGGCAYPELGSNGSGFALAREAGLKLVPPSPALAPLETIETWPGLLAGLTLPHARIRIALKGLKREGWVGPVLFTHKGISGPPVLNISGDVAERLVDAPVPILLIPRAERTNTEWNKLFAFWRANHGERSARNLLSGELPRKLAELLCEQAGTEGRAVAQIPRQRLGALAELCAQIPLTIKEMPGWAQAMVTRGGVSLKEIDPETLECRRMPGLRCAGEVLDLDGPCGGYNLTWAMAGGCLAGS